MQTTAPTVVVATLAGLMLSGCVVQPDRAPPVTVETPAGMEVIPGTYAATLSSTQWTLATQANPSLCGQPNVVVDASASYQDGMRHMLRRSFEHVIFVSAVLTPAQLKARRYDGQIVVYQGKATSGFSKARATSDVSIGVTFTIHNQHGVLVEKQISGRGSSKADSLDCLAVKRSIGEAARGALSSIVRDSALALNSTLSPRSAVTRAAPSPPKQGIAAKQGDMGMASPSQTSNTDAPEKKSADAPLPAQTVALAPSSATASPRKLLGDVGVGAEEAFGRGTSAAAGQGGARDDAAAVKWYRLAAEKGYAPAENNLGFFYAEGRGVARDDAEAVRWYRRAADRKYPPAQTSLGMMYQQGRGVPQSDFEALALYSDAANEGYAQAKANLAQMYAEGRGVARDERTANFLLSSIRERPRTGSGIYVDSIADAHASSDQQTMSH